MAATATDRTVIILSASSDIGQALTARYLAAGATVVGTYRAIGAVDAFASHPRAHMVRLDLNEPQDFARFSGTLRERGLSWDLFIASNGTMEPIGKLISIDNHAVRVVGVAEKKGSVFGESQDNFIWIPVTTFGKFYGTRRSIYIQAEARSMARLPLAIFEVTTAARSTSERKIWMRAMFCLALGMSTFSNRLTRWVMRRTAPCIRTTRSRYTCKRRR